MFANDDFDLDENFLKDISQKESKYYSEVLSSDEESSIKRIKNNEDSSEQSHSESISKFEELIHVKSKKDLLIQNTNEIGGKKTIRTNLILARLNRNENTSSHPRIHQYADSIDSQCSNLAESSLTQQPFLNPINDECRKNLILKKLRRSNVKSVSACPLRSVKKFCPTNVDSINPNDSKLEHRETIEKSQMKPVNTCNKRITLVRRFPGPAGLLPHSSDRILPPLVPESLCFDDSNNSTDTNVVENSPIISKYCSQNTAKSFSEGAWQLLMSDLSPDFLNRHQISTAKRKILTNLCQNHKLPFLAGTVQRVDFSRPDPLVVLKDCTGTIKGTVCRDILVHNPHFLDIGVVLFLGNVGCLTIGRYPKECHVIIMLESIINVYTYKSRVFSISEMDARLQNLNVECGLTMERIRANENADTELHSSNLENNSNYGKSADYTRKPMVVEECSENRHIHLEASKTATHKSTNLLENKYENSNSFQRDTNSLQCTNHVNIKSTSETGDLQDCDDDSTAFFFDIDDNLLFEAPTHIDPTTNSETKPPETKHSVSKVCNVGNKSTEIPAAAGMKKVTAPSASMQKSNLTTAADIKLKLSVFKSSAKLSPQPRKDSNVTSTKEFHKQNKSSSTSGLLLNAENDSDEELFSQLDLESIVSNYNRLNDVN